MRSGRAFPCRLVNCLPEFSFCPLGVHGSADFEIRRRSIQAPHRISRPGPMGARWGVFSNIRIAGLWVCRSHVKSLLPMEANGEIVRAI